MLGKEFKERKLKVESIVHEAALRKIFVGLFLGVFFVKLPNKLLVVFGST